MLWYFLYPLRGTSKPPTLANSHPIRRAFYRHGILTANYWLWVMLAAVAVGVALSYPTVFLSENPTAGFTSIPHHVWTAAKPVDDSENIRADVEMRQVWVHGSYMQALEKDVLKSALVIQQTLVGGERPTSLFPGLSDKLKSSELSWGYHSPLMYWNSSLEAIEADDDVVQTINDQSRSSSALNVALRPASVLAGKQFHQRKLIAADALVLTLMNKVEDGVGSQWQDKMHSLEGRACENCTLYPPHGEISRSHVYEFSFTPLSMRENIALAFAYGCMALYVIISLRRLKAFHSRFGLVVTAITQITTSIMASFTICGMLKINLATIPQNAYPFIVLVIGLENMFRIINAILAYPATMATDQRIANALGDIGPLSVATALQNIIILWLLAIIVSPGVKAFCAFAAIATLFDSFFLLTFFVAVLNVDIRRLELQDSLARSNQSRQHKRKASPSQRTWFDALMRGRVPFSTRMAGSAVTTTFILSLNYHFFEHKETTMTLRHLLGLAVGRGTPDLADFESISPPPMNPTTTPGEWIRMQDFDTAREVMRLVKPGAHDFVIRIFSPLIVVLSGADRTGVPQGFNVLTSALRGFALHHFYPFAVVVVFVVAFVAVLMNFLLWNESSDVSDPGAEEELNVQHVALPHSLDIVRMAGSRNSHFVTIALDRTIGIAIWDRSQGAYFVDDPPMELTTSLTWPIRDVAIDGTAEHVAFRCADDDVVIYRRRSRVFLKSQLRYPDDNPPLLFTFDTLATPDGLQEHLVLLTSGGRIATTSLVDGVVKTADLSLTPLLGASILKMDNHERQLFTVSEATYISAYRFSTNGWETASANVLYGTSDGAVTIEPLSEHISDLLILSTDAKIFFVDSQTLNVTASLDYNSALGRVTLLPGRVSRCPTCGSLALRSFALVSEADRRNELTMLTAGSEMREDGLHPICLKDMQAECYVVDERVESKNSVSPADTWHALPAHAILGLRKRPRQEEKATKHTQLRQRRHARVKTLTEQLPEEWEAYSLSLSGELKTVDVATNHDSPGMEGSLYVTEPGPIVRLDAQSVAVAFGNEVKVLKLRVGSGYGRERTQALEGHGNTMSRKRNGGGRKV